MTAITDPFRFLGLIAHLALQAPKSQVLAQLQVFAHALSCCLVVGTRTGAPFVTICTDT